jgi:DNA-binding IclR family transcriptional regulator
LAKATARSIAAKAKARSTVPKAAGDGAQSVHRALAVLRLVAMGQETGMRLTDIAELSGLSRPTVHRLLKVLMAETAVEQDAQTRRYLVGPELSLLGVARASRFPIRAIAEPYLRALAGKAGDTVFLSVRHGNDSVCIGRYLGSHQIQVLSINIGARRPLGASVSGVVLLAGMAQVEAKLSLQANARRLLKQKRSTQDVARDVRATRRLGHFYAAQGVMPGTSALAVPVQDAQGRVLAAISIAALAPRLDAARWPVVLATMREHAKLITLRWSEVERARPRRRGGEGVAVAS